MKIKKKLSQKEKPNIKERSQSPLRTLSGSCDKPKDGSVQHHLNSLFF